MLNKCHEQFAPCGAELCNIHNISYVWNIYLTKDLCFCQQCLSIARKPWLTHWGRGDKHISRKQLSNFIFSYFTEFNSLGCESLRLPPVAAGSRCVCIAVRRFTKKTIRITQSLTCHSSALMDTTLVSVLVNTALMDTTLVSVIVNTALMNTTLKLWCDPADMSTSGYIACVISNTSMIMITHARPSLSNNDNTKKFPLLYV